MDVKYQISLPNPSWYKTEEKGIKILENNKILLKKLLGYTDIEIEKFFSTNVAKVIVYNVDLETARDICSVFKFYNGGAYLQDNTYNFNGHSHIYEWDELGGLKLDYSLESCDKLPIVPRENLNINMIKNYIIPESEKIAQTSVSKVQCPYCKSTNTKKITTASKATHTFMFGIFSIGRNSKNYHCNNCKSDF